VSFIYYFTDTLFYFADVIILMIGDAMVVHLEGKQVQMMNLQMKIGKTEVHLVTLMIVVLQEKMGAVIGETRVHHAIEMEKEKIGAPHHAPLNVIETGGKIVMTDQGKVGVIVECLVM
jgi:hypothetical protein